MRYNKRKHVSKFHLS